MPAGGDCFSVCSVARLREHRCQCRKPPAIAIATRTGAPAGAASAHGAGRQTCVPGFFLAAFCNKATHSGTPCARLPRELHLRLNGCFGKKSAQHRQPQVETLHDSRQADVHENMVARRARARSVEPKLRPFHENSIGSYYTPNLNQLLQFQDRKAAREMTVQCCRSKMGTYRRFRVSTTWILNFYYVRKKLTDSRVRRVSHRWLSVTNRRYTQKATCAVHVR